MFNPNSAWSNVFLQNKLCCVVHRHNQCLSEKKGCWLHSSCFQKKNGHWLCSLHSAVPRQKNDLSMTWQKPNNEFFFGAVHCQKQQQTKGNQGWRGVVASQQSLARENSLSVVGFQSSPTWILLFYFPMVSDMWKWPSPQADLAKKGLILSWFVS